MTTKEALEQAVAALGGDSGTIHLRDAERMVLRLEAVHGPMPEPVLAAIREIPWGKGMAGLAAERVEPVQTCNIQTTTSADVRPGARATGMGGAVVVPILLGGDVVGTIGVGCRAEREFSAAEAEALAARGRDLARRIARPPADALREILGRRVDAAALAWLEECLGHARRGDRESVLRELPAAARKLGRGPAGAFGALVTPDREVPLRAFRIDDAGRVLILLSFAGDQEGLAREAYFGGDPREKASALRALAVLGASAGPLDVLLDALRVGAVDLFEAAIADSPWASRVLPDFELRKAVLKCAFVGVSLDRIVALDARADAELSRMLLSYVTEREAAGRSVPADLWPVMARAPAPGLVAKLTGTLEHPSEAHRVAAARGLGLTADPRARPFLEDRLAREPDERVARAIRRALG